MPPVRTPEDQAFPSVIWAGALSHADVGWFNLDHDLYSRELPGQQGSRRHVVPVDDHFTAFVELAGP
jgi:hypothetical protein